MQLCGDYNTVIVSFLWACIVGWYNKVITSAIAKAFRETKFVKNVCIPKPHIAVSVNGSPQSCVCICDVLKC